MILALLAVILLFAIGGGVWYMNSRIPETRAVSFTSPAGGEAWQAGEERTILWTASGIPASERMSITIRRIPPPPLQEEGQEFDPIIATALPNTGSFEWKIAPMYPDGTYALGITAYDSVPITDALTAESNPFTIAHPALAGDAYPLYEGVAWQRPQLESFLIGSTSYSGASVASYPVTDTMDPGSVFTPFERFYDRKLKALGYRVANDLAAGGHVGGQTGYRKGDSLILTRCSIDYKTRPENAPSECPCDVTLSVFSSPAK